MSDDEEITTEPDEEFDEVDEEELFLWLSERR